MKRSETRLTAGQIAARLGLTTAAVYYWMDHKALPYRVHKAGAQRTGYDVSEKQLLTWLRRNKRTEQLKQWEASAN